MSRQYLERMINLNEAIFRPALLPGRSNSLKAIGGFLGAVWAEPDASGLQSLVWRYNWEESRDGELKARLLRYNQEDCLAVQILWDELLRIKASAESNDRVEFADRPKQFASEMGSQVHARFEEILRSAHANYQKNRICTRTDDNAPADGGRRKRGGQQGHPKYQRILPTKADRIINVARKRICPSDRERLQPSDQFAESYQIDLRLTKKGCKKIDDKIQGNEGILPDLRAPSSPAHDQPA